MQSDEYYVRDVSGKEIATYSGSSLTQWNIWGLDNVGKINADTTRNYYLKDHLGSIRVVLNSTNTVISAQDYDAWGYQLENRSYNSSAMKYDFTGKERDNETSYDYFGARYYDSRIANWTSIDPLFEKHIQWSSYNYVLRNPIRLIDPDGKQIDFYYVNGSNSATMVINNPLIDMKRVYIEHSSGLIKGPDQKELSGKTFIEAHSEETMFEYMQNNNFTYNTSSVVTDFENNEFGNRVDEAISEFVPGENPLKYALKNSPDGGIMDQKRNLSKGTAGLYIFGGIAYSRQETGNIIWGNAVRKLGIPIEVAIAGAQLFAATKGFLDQPNELEAINTGYEYADKAN